MMGESSGWFDARVREVRALTDDVRYVEFETTRRVAMFTPGSHVKLRVMIEGLPDTRHYSIVRGGVDWFGVAVRRMPASRGGSTFVHALAENEHVLLSGPYNHFSLSWGRPEYLVIGGGIGVTPLISMVDALQRRGAQYRFIYAGRTRASMPFVDELEQLHAERSVILTDEDAVPLDFDREFSSLASGAEAYVCGPLGMQEAAREAWVRSGRTAQLLRFETFANSGDHEAEEFTVFVEDHDVEVKVPASETLLDALARAGIAMVYGCRRGECGLCVVETKLVDRAVIDHRDVFLDAAQHADSSQMCTCVSRAVGGTITIDTGYRSTAEGLHEGAPRERHRA